MYSDIIFDILFEDFPSHKSATTKKPRPPTLIKNIKIKHIGMLEYHDKMNLYHHGHLDDKEIKELEEDIKSWELFRITGLVGWGNYDVDGIPTPLLQEKLKEWTNTDFSGGDKGMDKYICCFTIEQFSKEEDEKKLHSSQGTKYKNIGEKYRTLEHQHMMYRIHIIYPKK